MGSQAVLAAFERNTESQGQTNPDVEVIDDLGIKHARPADSGDGTFLTLGQSRTCHLKRRPRVPSWRGSRPKSALLCAQSEICARWGSFFGYDALDMNPFGYYLKTALPLATESKPLSLASQYALDSLAALRFSTQQSRLQAHSSGAKALKALKATVPSCQSIEDIQSLSLAILLHFAAEVKLISRQN